MAEALRAVPVIELLLPDDVPGAAAVAGRLTPAAKRACLAALAAPALRPKTALAALARDIDPAPPQPWQDVKFLIETGQTSDFDTHDHFFRIRRSGHADPLGYLRGLFLTLDRLALDLAEAPTRLGAVEIADIGDGLRRAAAAALGAPPPSTHFACPLAQAPARPDYAQWRWLRGHHVFAALTQGLIFAADAMGDAHARNDEAALAAAGDLNRALLLASARALELTGDFPTEIYSQTIRPSMEAPFQPKGFSGILSADHRVYVSKMRALRPAVDRLRETAPQTHAAMAAALGAAYDSHKFVCGRFVGADQASLLMASECQRSAVDQIERFKQMRLRAVQ